ncbi:MAG TPA: hypothetical protein VIN11_03210 [Roseivirga sp.]
MSEGIFKVAHRFLNRTWYFHPMRIKGYWLFIFLGLTIGAFFFYQQNQPVLSYDFAPAFDGNDYRNIYDYFKGYREDFKVPHPFHQRVFVPYLASLLGGDIIPSFQWVNLFFTLLAVYATFLLWRSLGFELKWFWAGFIWLIFHWTGIIRLNAFDPITVDVPTYAFQAFFLWLIIKRKFIHLIWLAPLATVQKESFMALPILLVVYAMWHNRRTQEGFYDIPIIAAAVVLSIATQSVVNHYFPPIEEGKGALITLAYHAKEAVVNPFEIVRWLAAISMAFGPAIWLAMNHYRKTNRYDNQRNLLIVFTALYLAFGILAGGDMTRIIFLGFPFIATWIIYELQEISRPQLILLGLLSLPLTFIWRVIPDPGFMWEAWESWYPEFTRWEIVSAILIYSIFMTLILQKGSNKSAIS